MSTIYIDFETEQIFNRYHDYRNYMFDRYYADYRFEFWPSFLTPEEIFKSFINKIDEVIKLNLIERNVLAYEVNFTENHCVVVDFETRRCETINIYDMDDYIFRNYGTSNVGREITVIIDEGTYRVYTIGGVVGETGKGYCFVCEHNY